MFVLFITDINHYIDIKNDKKKKKDSADDSRSITTTFKHRRNHRERTERQDKKQILAHPTHKLLKCDPTNFKI